MQKKYVQNVRNGTFLNCRLEMYIPEASEFLIFPFLEFNCERFEGIDRFHRNRNQFKGQERVFITSKVTQRHAALISFNSIARQNNNN